MMKKPTLTPLLVAFLTSFALLFAGCENNGFEDAADETGDAIEDAGEEVDDALN